MVTLRERNTSRAVGVFASYGEYVGVSQFCLVVFFALARGWNCSAAFLSHVIQIVSLGAQKQMIWAYASWIVAVMADAGIIWDRAECQFPSHTVRKDSSPFAPVRSDTTSIWTYTSGPQPTGWRAIDLSPELKAFSFWSGFRHDHPPMLPLFTRA